MNTPAHILFAASAFAKPDSPKTLSYAMLGGIAPDLSLYILVGFSLFVLNHEPSHIFNIQYFSAEWQNVFAIDNSFILWLSLLAFAHHRAYPAMFAFAGGAFIHLCFDFSLHHDDARQHFWPLSDWVFISPISYWDKAHYGQIIMILELSLFSVLFYVLWHRYKSFLPRLTFMVLAVLEFAPLLIFYLALK